MYQVLGCVFVLFACFLFALGKTEQIKRKLENLKEMQKALFLMKNEISFCTRELKEALNVLATFLSGDVKALFFKVGAHLSENETLSFYEAWDKALSKNNALFSKETEKVLKDFAGKVGTLSRELEGEHIEKTEALLGKVFATEEAAYQKNRKLIYALSGLFGAAVLILFI